jgi:hypothetical protein
MSLLDEARKASQCVISVMGPHAGEDASAILERKVADCEVVGRTFWVAKSAKARPPQVQTLCSAGPSYVIFVEPAGPGGTRPTMESESAAEFSQDRVVWRPLPRGINPVTGQMDDSAVALVLGGLTTDVEGTVDLWGYADGSDLSKPIKFILGQSTVCAVKKDMSAHPQRMKSRFRSAVAVARLVEPYCVWVR